MPVIQTPFYLIDQAKLLRNMEIIDRLRAGSGAKALLALKCFATWSAFDLMREHMDGTTSSSLYELRLGREKFGKETHAYSVAWADHEIAEAVGYADKIIFNSIGQLERFDNQSAQITTGKEHVGEEEGKHIASFFAVKKPAVRKSAGKTAAKRKTKK